MELNTIFNLLLGGGNVVAIISLLSERKKRKAQSKISEADALLSMQNVYDRFVKDSENNYKNLEQKYQQVWMKCEVHEKRLEDQRLAYNQLKTKINNYEKKCINNCGA